MSKLWVKFFGALIMGSSYFINPFYLDGFLSPDGHFDFSWLYWTGTLISIIIFCLGFFCVIRPISIIKKKKDIILSLITIMSCFVVIELSLRLYDLYDKYNNFDRAFNEASLPGIGVAVNLGDMIKLDKDETTIFGLKPGLDVLFKDQKVRTNSQGFRDEEFNLDQSSTTIRIAGIGDSVIFGWGVPEDKRYLDLLENKLQNDYPNFNWQTYNFGTPGYSLINTVSVLKNRVLEYKPDLIIYGHIANDHCLPYFLKADKNFFSPNLRIFDYLNPYFRILGGGLVDYDFYIRHSLFDLCTKQEAPERYRHLVGEKVFWSSFHKLLELSASAKVPIAVFSFIHIPPNYLEAISEIGSDFPYYFINAIEALDKYLKQNQVQSFDLAPDDSHPSVAGHALLADELYSGLINKGIINELIKNNE